MSKRNHGNNFDEYIIYTKEAAEHEAEYADFPEKLSPKIAAYLHSQGII